MDDWYEPSPALLAAIRQAFDAEAKAATPVEFERVWERIRLRCMAEPDGFARLFGAGDASTLAGDARNVVELALAFGTAPGLKMGRDAWGRWVVVPK